MKKAPKAPKAPKRVKPFLANTHYDKTIEKQVEARAAELYPDGCVILLGHDQAYVMPDDWYAGPGYVLPYSGGEARAVTFEDVEKMKRDSPPKPDPFGWLT